MRVMTQADVAREKAKRAASVYECRAAIADCHDTLKVGHYEYGHPYAQKLWAEIDAYRDRIRELDPDPKIR